MAMWVYEIRPPILIFLWLNGEVFQFFCVLSVSMENTEKILLTSTEI